MSINLLDTHVILHKEKVKKLLSYAQILVWYNHFPELAKFAFKTMVHYIDSDFFSKPQ